MRETTKGQLIYCSHFKIELEHLTIPSVIIRGKKCFIAIAFLLIFMFLTRKDQLLLVKERIITFRYPIY